MSSRRKPSYPQDTNAGASPSPSPSTPSSFPGGPVVSGQTVYYKGQDGRGAGVVCVDSSGNGHDSTAAGVDEYLPHPIVQNRLLRWYGALPTFPDTGVVAPLECSFEFYCGPFAANANIYYGEATKDFVGIRRVTGTFLVFTNTWVAVPNVLVFSPLSVHTHLRRTSGTLPGDAKVEFFCNGELVYTSADFTPLASGTTGRIVPSSNNVYWSHISFWPSPKTNEEIKTQASYFT